MSERNLTLMTDLYQLTMMQGYFLENHNEMVIFDMFYRKNPSGNGYAIACGLEGYHFTTLDAFRTYLHDAGILSRETER